jgi:AraC-like DNA-binding protein
MKYAQAKRLGEIPGSDGVLTRLAYARVKAGGIDGQPLLKKANLTLAQIKDPAQRLRARDQIGFMNLAATALGDSLFGFHLAQPVDLREFGFLYYVSASSGTLGEALQQLARYTSSVNESVSLKVLDGAPVGVRLHYVGVSRHLDRHQMEFVVTLLVRLCRQLTGLNLVPTNVRLVHRRDDKVPELTKFFGRKVEFGAAVDEVSFASNLRSAPVVSADHHLNKLLIRYREESIYRRPNYRGSFRSEVENAIVLLLPHGKAQVSEIARRLGVSQRTLARRLSAEGLTFSDVLEALKVDLAERYLADRNLTISQIAWLLGYQEVSSLTHAFKRWTGKTPRVARSQAVSDPVRH